MNESWMQKGRPEAAACKNLSGRRAQRSIELSELVIATGLPALMT